MLADIDAAALNEAGRQVYQALTDWRFGCPSGLDGIDLDTAAPVGDPEVIREAAGCSAFHVVLGRVLTNTFSDELAAANVEWRPDAKALVRLLKRPELMQVGATFWDDVTTGDDVETRTQVVTQALNSAGAWLRENQGPMKTDWLWGRIHNVSLLAPLINDAGITDYNHGPFANDGGLYTVDVAKPAHYVDDDYRQEAGASMRFACEMTSPPNCTMQLPGGQRHLRTEAHYNDLLPGWLTNTSFPLLFRENAVAEATVETIELVPAAP